VRLWLALGSVSVVDDVDATAGALRVSNGTARDH
jgi:hypothetical protein